MLPLNLVDLDVANLLMRERIRLAAKAALAAQAAQAEKTRRARHRDRALPTDSASRAHH